MAKANGDRLDSEWVMQQAMAMRAMEQVCVAIYLYRQCSVCCFTSHVHVVAPSRIVHAMSAQNSPVFNNHKHSYCIFQMLISIVLTFISLCAQYTICTIRRPMRRRACARQ